jgi:anti-sigma B factor antagonist
MLQIEPFIADSIFILKLNGRFDTQAADKVRKELEAATAVSPTKIIVDLTGVDFIDSTALAVLVQAMKRSRQHGGDVRLAGLRPNVRIIFELTRLDQVFEIYPELPDAATMGG